MANKGKISTQINSESPTLLAEEIQAQSRQREDKPRFDKSGNLLIKQGVLLRRDLYQKYRRHAFFRHLNTYDLINDALAAYLPYLAGAHSERLKAAGVAELDLET